MQMYSFRDLGEVLRTTGLLLIFRPVVPDLKRLGPLYLLVGLLSAWLAGIGRHWDNPKVAAWQYLGLGSVAYVYVFSFLLWIVLWPLKPKNWAYNSVLTFVALTAPPAFLYTLPGRFLPKTDIQIAVTWLLPIVAIWRVALLTRYLHRSAGLNGGDLSVAVCLPLALLVTSLTFLNLDHAVFSLMGGGGERTPNDLAYGILILIELISILASPILLISYAVLCFKKRKPRAS